MTTLLPEEVQAVVDSDADLAEGISADANAQAEYKTLAAEAIAQMYQDKADASRTFDNAIATALVNRIATEAADQANLTQGLITEQTRRRCGPRSPATATRRSPRRKVWAMRR